VAHGNEGANLHFIQPGVRNLIPHEVKQPGLAGLHDGWTIGWRDLGLVEALFFLRVGQRFTRVMIILQGSFHVPSGESRWFVKNSLPDFRAGQAVFMFCSLPLFIGKDFQIPVFRIPGILVKLQRIRSNGCWDCHPFQPSIHGRWSWSSHQ
jgi:hypothetical protein